MMMRTWGGVKKGGAKEGETKKGKKRERGKEGKKERTQRARGKDERNQQMGEGKESDVNRLWKELWKEGTLAGKKG